MCSVFLPRAAVWCGPYCVFFALGMSILAFFVKRLPSRGAGPFKAFSSFLACVILNFLSHVLGTDVYQRPVTAGTTQTCSPRHLPHSVPVLATPSAK